MTDSHNCDHIRTASDPRFYEDAACVSSSSVELIHVNIQPTIVVLLTREMISISELGRVQADPPLEWYGRFSFAKWERIMTYSPITSPLNDTNKERFLTGVTGVIFKMDYALILVRQGSGKCHNLVQKRVTILSSSSSSSHSIGYCPETKTFRSLCPSVPLLPKTVPLSAASLALSLQSDSSWRDAVVLIDATTGHRISYFEFHCFTRNLTSSLSTTVRLCQNDVAFIIASNLISVPVLYFIVPLTGNYHFSCQSTHGNLSIPNGGSLEISPLVRIDFLSDPAKDIGGPNMSHLLLMWEIIPSTVEGSFARYGLVVATTMRVRAALIIGLVLNGQVTRTIFQNGR
ncbi:4-coumarate--CoA ligase [Forsythia ovata]|uniref:4-coumarate--CoA ligase n=1 Tax=Forsythia ovata TaxID=205694 RepID=A0ABD1WC32_9LAMI